VGGFSAVRGHGRPLALGALLGLGLLAVGFGAVESAAVFRSAASSNPLVKVSPTVVGTVPPTAPGDAGGVYEADDTITPTATTVPTSAVGATTVASSAATTIDPAALDPAFGAFDQSLASQLLGHGALAVSVAVAKNGTFIHQAAFGVANPLTGERATPASRFRIASNSKMLTATAVMELVQNGALDLDRPALAPLADRLGVKITDPGIAAITLRQLLSHTSGFPEYERTFFGGGATSCPDAARKALTGQLLGPPGTIYRYSNMNFCVLGLLVEQVTGQPYEAVVDEHVLRPLGIDDMRMAGTYDVRPGDVAHPTTPGRNFMEVLGGAGAWLGTAADLVRIVDGLDTTRPGWHPLSRATLGEMLAPHPGIVYSNGQWYGLGLRVWADGTWGHTGTVENARSMVIRRPDGLTWAVMVSGNAPSSTDRLRARVDKAFATIGVAAPPTTLAMPPAPASAPTTVPTTTAA
jgi:D-alanyl-D-alanine carboxypeptidase